MKHAEQIARHLLSQAGITVNGDQPWDIQVKDRRFFQRVLREGTLGVGEAYMDGWWDVGALDELMYRAARRGLMSVFSRNWHALMLGIVARVYNLSKPSRAFEIGQRHYDIGNDLFVRMLDKRMTYTCAYWEHASTLDEAQEAKLDLVCRKIGLEKEMRVLDIGCGWGSFVKFAAEKYGVSAVGITVSKEQAQLARKHCEGLPVDIRLQDYRDVHEQFDRIISLGMIEHVGYKNYRTYMKVAREALTDGGLFLLHTIGSSVSVKGGDPWIEKYIFPNSMLPSAAQLARAAEGLFVMEDWHNFGADYDKTLMAWWHNFDVHWNEIKHAYGERFYRMWKFYLLSCAGLFRARSLQLWQIVFSKQGVEGGYAHLR